jgi:tRNA threonylcarbamoyladenosine biosynthesis protein TsaB
MKILCVDTSSRILCLGVADGDKVYEYNLQLGTKISALLVPSIERVIKALGWQIGQIDYFCCGVGPGSFTGVRIGMASVKALSWSLNKPVAGVSSLDILAQNSGKEEDFIIPVIDAKRSLVYASIYQNQSGRIKRIAPYMLLDPSGLAKKIRKTIRAKSFSDCVMLGDGLNICSKECSDKLKGIRFLDKDYWRLEARNIVELAKTAIRQKRSVGAFKLSPLYLYPKECQIRLHAHKK